MKVLRHKLSVSTAKKASSSQNGDGDDDDDTVTSNHPEHLKELFDYCVRDDAKKEQSKILLKSSLLCQFEKYYVSNV